MRRVGVAVRTLLTGDAAVAGLAGDRVYAVRAPDRVAAPYVLHAPAGGQRWEVLGGPAGLVQTRMQIDALAVTYEDAWELADAIRRALNGYRGTIGAVRIGGVSLPVPGIALYEDLLDPPLFRVTQDFLIIHDEE